MALVVDEDVLGLDVAVQHRVPVQERQALENLSGYLVTRGFCSGPSVAAALPSDDLLC